MMDRSDDLVSLFDRSTDEIAGRAPAELAATPGLSDELAPLLETVSVMKASAPPPAPAVDEARFAELMAAVRSIPQDRPRRWPRLPAPRDVFRRWGTRIRIVVPAGAAAVALMLAVLLLVVPVDHASAARLEVLAGVIEEQHDGVWRPLGSDAEVSEGSRLRASEDAEARLTFADGDTLMIIGAAELVVVRHRDEGGTVELDQLRGRLTHEVAPRSEPTFTLSTVDATLVTSGGRFVSVVGEQGTLVSVLRGSLSLQAGDERLLLHAGDEVRAKRQVIVESVLLPGDGPPTPAPGEPKTATLVIPAQFDVSVIAPNGAVSVLDAAEASIDGLLDLDTSAGDGVLELALTEALTAGTYRLLLRRTSDGVADVALRIDNTTTVVTLEGEVNEFELRLEVAPGLLGTELTLFDITSPHGGPMGEIEPTAGSAVPTPGGGLTQPQPPADPADPQTTESPDPIGPAETSGVRGGIDLVAVCVSTLLAEICPELPSSVELVIETASGVEVLRTTVAIGSTFSIALAPGTYRAQVSVAGLIAHPSVSTPFTVSEGSWSELSLMLTID